MLQQKKNAYIIDTPLVHLTRKWWLCSYTVTILMETPEGVRKNSKVLKV